MGAQRPDRRARGAAGAPRPEGRLTVAATEALRRDRHRRRPQRPGRGRAISARAGLANAGPRAARARRRRGRHLGAAPGVRVPTLAHTVGRLRPSVVRDLELRAHGLSLVAPEVRVFAPSPDGSAITLLGATSSGPPTGSGAVAGATRRPTPSSTGCVRALAGFLGRPRRADAARHRVAGSRRRARRAPARADVPRPRAARTAARSAGRCRWRWPTSSRNRSRPTRLRAAIAWRGVQYTAMGPWSAGTTAVLLTDGPATMGERPARRCSRAAGPGALSDALAASARASGVEIRTGAAVASITSSDGRATGVVLESGEEIAARAVVSGDRPEADADGLVDPVEVGPNAAVAGRQTSGRRARSPRSTSRSAALPTVRRRRRRAQRSSADGSSSRRRSTRWNAPTTRRSTAGWRDEPILEATIPSLVDPSLVDGAARRARTS